MIRAARKKFEEKEASKTQKDERRRERQRQKSISETKPWVEGKDSGPSSSSSSTKQETRSSLHKSRRKSSARAGASREEEEDNNEKLHAKSYEDYRPAHAASLPVYGDLPGESEKRPMHYAIAETGKKSSKGTKPSAAHHSSWTRFSTWCGVRILSCGDRN
jgi:hypothetical protein